MALTQVSSDVLNNSQANITQVGTLSDLTVSGNIGIGTSVTSSKLHVLDDSYPFGVQGLFQSFNNRAAVTAVNDFGELSVGVDDGDVVGGFNRTGTIGGAFIYTSQYRPIVFYTNATEVMRIDPLGNVGIGSDNPTEKLHVVGNISANYFTGNGALLTGIVAGSGGTNYSNTNVAAYLTANPQPGTYSNTNVASFLTSASITTSGNISAARFTGNGASLTGLTATMVGLGSVTNESKATMFTSPTFTGTVTMQQAVELYSSPSISANAVTLNFTNGAIFALGSNASNITANFTNIPGIAGRTIATTLIITQGATAYIPSVVTINGGASATIRWQGGSVPSGTANRISIVSFTFVCTATNTWTVIGSLTDYN
jgi:hypothetical protein